jgi:hypothetical protein
LLCIIIFLNVFFFFEPEHSKERLKVEACKVDYAPFTYVLTSDQLETNKIMINRDWCKPSTSSNHRQSSHNLIAHKDLYFQDHFVYVANEIKEHVQSI